MRRHAQFLAIRLPQHVPCSFDRHLYGNYAQTSCRGRAPRPTGAVGAVVHEEDLPDVSPATSGAHFQMFLSGRPPLVRWRLLSGNNRDLCHGVDPFPDEQRCQLAIKQFMVSISDFHPVIKRDDQGGWTWMLLDAGAPVAVAGHSYDRQIRCARALSKVLQDADSASIGLQLVISDHRRWAGTTRVTTKSDRPRRIRSSK